MEIIHYPHPTLRHASKPVMRVDRELKQIVAEMFERMYEARGVGLAANQVDLPLRLFVANLEAEPGKGDELVFINPVVSRPRGGGEESEEGCLSIPGVYAPVIRPKQVRVEAYDLAGNEIRLEAEGLLSRVIQHETDHLDGVLFIDKVRDRDAIEGPLEEFEIEFRHRRESGSIADDEQLQQRREQWEGRYCR